MKLEIIPTLEKNKIILNENDNPLTSSGCCGGSPKNNAEACCILDEEKKADGEEGCGCNTSEAITPKISCC